MGLTLVVPGTGRQSDKSRMSVALAAADVTDVTPGKQATRRKVDGVTGAGSAESGH